MLSYVLSSGFNHLAHIDPGSTVVLEALQSLGSDVRHYPSHWERLCELREEVLGWPYPPWPSSRHDVVLYILIAYSSPTLLQSFLSGGCSLKPRVGTNPLVYAADLHKTEHAMVLLACGADMNARGFVVDDSRHALPLEVAIDLGEDVLVGELLQRGCVVTSELLTTAVCMPWCSTRVLVKLMQTGEFAEWAHEIGDEKLYRGVFNSARPNPGDSKKTDEDHVALARILRRIGQDLSADSPFGAELIERAVHAAHTSLLEFLLPPDQPPPPRFLLTASTGDTSETVSVVRFLLRKGADIHAVSDGRRDTALHFAVMCPWEPRRLELVQILINAGCNPHSCNLRGETPFTIAIKRGYSSVVELLLSYNGPFPPNILPIVLRETLSPQIVQSLVRKGADVHSTTSNGDTVLHLAMSERDESRCLDLVKSFIEAGCNPASRNSKGQTVLDAAIQRGYTSVVDLLLMRSVPLPPDILLFALRRRSSLNIVQLLIQKGADVHLTTSNGDNVLHLAMSERDESRCLDLVKSFIEAGCNPTSCNSEGQTVLDAAIQRGYTLVIELLLSCNVSFPPDILQRALYRRSTLQMVQFLIHKGADVHSTAFNGDTILHLAITEHVESRRLDLVKIFIGAGCNPAACNFEGKTVLVAAIECGCASVVEFLLLYNVPLPPNILLITLWRHSPLQMVQFLIGKGANVHSTMPNGDTVLHLAITEYVEGACYYLVKDFIEAGCNPTACNSSGKTVLEAAIGRGYTFVVEFLVLSCNVPLPRDNLPIALLRRFTPQMIQLLVDKNHVTASGSDWDAPLHASYSGEDRQEVINILDAARNACRMHPRLRDVSPIHVAKRPRLE